MLGAGLLVNATAVLISLYLLVDFLGKRRAGLGFLPSALFFIFAFAFAVPLVRGEQGDCLLEAEGW